MVVICDARTFIYLPSILLMHLGKQTRLINVSTPQIPFTKNLHFNISVV